MVNVAVLGYGTVGSGVYDVLTKNKDSIAKKAGDEINVKYVLDLREFPGDPVNQVLVHDFDTIVNDPEVPGAIVHFVERFYKKGYEELLVESIKRKPTMHTVWMLNRIINGSENKKDYIELMKAIIEHNDIEDEIRNQARAFMNT